MKTLIDEDADVLRLPVLKDRKKLEKVRYKIFILQRIIRLPDSLKVENYQSDRLQMHLLLVSDRDGLFHGLL